MGVLSAIAVIPLIDGKISKDALIFSVDLPGMPVGWCAAQDILRRVTGAATHTSASARDDGVSSLRQPSSWSDQAVPPTSAHAMSVNGPEPDRPASSFPSGAGVTPDGG